METVAALRWSRTCHIFFTFLVGRIWEIPKDVGTALGLMADQPTPAPRHVPEIAGLADHKGPRPP